MAINAFGICGFGKFKETKFKAVRVLKIPIRATEVNSVKLNNESVEYKIEPAIKAYKKYTESFPNPYSQRLEAMDKIARLQANSELFFAKVLMKMAVNFANAEEVVLYTPA